VVHFLQIEKQVSRLPGGRYYPRPVGHDQPLTLQMPSFTPLTSADWLAKHGLKGNVHSLLLSVNIGILLQCKGKGEVGTCVAPQVNRTWLH